MAIDTYCLEADVTDRLRQSGVDYLADDDLDESIDSDETAASLTKAVAAAAGEIDTALQKFFVVPLSQSENNLNRRLRSVAVDLAAEWMAGRGGGDVGDALSGAAQRAREFLADVATGAARVPGLAYPGDSDSDRIRRLGRPRARTPRLRRR
jgi:phage gp36-like protein